MCHVNELPRYHAIELPYYLWLQFEELQLEDSKTYHVVKLFCGRRFATLFVLCVPSCGVLRLQLLQLLGCPPTTPAADR